MNEQSLTEMYIGFHKSIEHMRNKPIEDFLPEYQAHAIVHQKFMLSLEAEALSFGISYEAAKEAFVISLIKLARGGITGIEYDELMNLIVSKYREDDEKADHEKTIAFINAIDELMCRYWHMFSEIAK